jgi:small-conductance mechanosensitive channel
MQNKNPDSLSGTSQNFMDRIYWMNPVSDYLYALLIIIGGVIAYRIVRKILLKKFSIFDNLYIQYILKLENYAAPLIILFIIYSTHHYLAFSDKVEQISGYIFTVAFIFLFIRLITAAVRNAIQSYFGLHDETGGKLRQIRGLILILNGILWAIGLIFLFDNLGFNVTAVITGLGVGGIAIALAAQTILGDIFNYFVIFFDRPFELGDFIIVDDKLGTVEYIGIKTTRLKSLQGEQIVFSNSNLTNSRIHNYKRMAERRTVFKIGVVYTTTKENLKAIPTIIREIIEKQSDVRFDRAHFSTFGDYSLIFEVVYYILSADYNRYAQIQQDINLQIFEQFENRGIEFAIPTYTVFVNQPTETPKNNGRRLSETTSENRN